jgi:hypothetical protein
MEEALLEKEEAGMPSPALDDKPDTDAYTDLMVDAYGYIQKGCNDRGMIPISEVHSYYNMFEDSMVETKRDFLYLIYQMNQPVLDQIKERLEKQGK